MTTTDIENATAPTTSSLEVAKAFPISSQSTSSSPAKNKSVVTTTTSVPVGNSNHTTHLQTLPQATTAMCLGIASLIVFGIILGPIAICIGVNAKNTIRANPDKYMGEGQATTGIVCGSIAIILWIIVIIIVATGAVTTTTTAYDYYGYN